MSCRHCQQPIQRCAYAAIHGITCKGYIHSHNTMHGCGHHTDMHAAEPEPGQPDEVSAPVKGVA